MRKLINVILVVGIALATVCWSLQECHASSARSELLSIRIDAAGRVWWHEHRASKENLPQLLCIEADSECSLDYSALYTVLEDYIGRYREAPILILVHPAAHYMHLDNFLSIVEAINIPRVERIDSMISTKIGRLEETTGEESRILNHELRWLEGNRLLGPDAVLGLWADRDDRIMQFAVDAVGVEAIQTNDVPIEHQFLRHYENDYWKNRFPDWFTVSTPLPPIMLPNERQTVKPIN